MTYGYIHRSENCIVHRISTSRWELISRDKLWQSRKWDDFATMVPKRDSFTRTTVHKSQKSMQKKNQKACKSQQWQMALRKQHHPDIKGLVHKTVVQWSRPAHVSRERNLNTEEKWTLNHSLNHESICN